LRLVRKPREGQTKRQVRLSHASGGVSTELVDFNALSLDVHKLAPELKERLVADVIDSQRGPGTDVAARLRERPAQLAWD